MKRLPTFIFLVFFVAISSRLTQAEIIAEFEGPADGQTAAGVGLIRGWAFSDQPGVRITQVTLQIDNKLIGSIPCCSERPDVRDAFPQYPADNTLNSGFGLIRNYGVHSNGPHTFTITIQDSSGGAPKVLTHTVTTVKIGGSEFLDQLSISAAQIDLQGQEVLLSNVQARDKATQQLSQVDLRLRWDGSLQGLSIIDATASGVAPAAVRTAPLAEQIVQPLVSDLQAVFESPGNGGTASGIGVIRGWTFPPAGRTIQSVQLFVDGNLFQSIPCCSTRQDVADAFPGEPNAKNSGFGVTFNYGRLLPGAHTIGVLITDSSGSFQQLQSQVTVVAPAGFEFLDEFDLSEADFRINAEELVISGVKVRDKATQQTSFRTLRFHWDTASQGFILVHDGVDSGQLISDSFDDGSMSDWTVISGQWSIIQGELVETSDLSTPSIVINRPEVSDFQLTAQLRSTDDDAIGFVFRFHDSSNYYFVEFHSQKSRIQLRKLSSGVASVLSTTTPFSLVKGVPIEAAVRVQGTRVQVFVNGRVALDFTDSSADSGKVGLYSQANKYAAFDDVHLTTLTHLKTEAGNTVYVDSATAGAPQDGQTPATAWSTIAQALRDPRFSETAGNTIVIASGLYREQVDILGHMSGIPGAFNTIRAAEGADVIVDGEKNTPNARREGVLIHTGVRYIRVEGLHIQNAQHRGILVFESGPGELVGNQIHLCGDSGMEFWYGARNYAVVNNVVHHNEQHGIVLAQGSGNDPSRFGANRAIQIRNNLITKNGPDGGDGVTVQDTQMHSFTIHNNTIVGNSGDGISITSAPAIGDIRNNVVVNNNLIGLKMTPDELVPRGYNNLFNNGAGGTRNFDCRHCPGTGSISADPLFVNLLAGDFHLQAGSPSIDTGAPESQFNDVDGTRNDMGAYGGPFPLPGTPSVN
jgi:hypothetical protein